MAEPWSSFNFNPAALVADALSAGAIILTIAGYLPLFAAGVGLIWYGICIWESKTIQGWWRGRQMRLNPQRIAKLRAKEKIIQARITAMEVLRQAEMKAQEKVELAKVEAKADIDEAKVDG